MSKRIVVGISGASGAPYARRFLQLALAADVEVHLVASPLGQRLISDELGLTLPQLIESLQAGPGRLHLHAHKDVGAPIASGSFLHDGMVIVPCSNNSLAAIAGGMSENLLHRAASVTLKERRPLILCHRETPLSLIEIRNMQRATEAGAIIAPANPGFYMMPRSIDDLLNFIAGRLLDLLKIPHTLNIRWKQDPASGQA